MLDLNLISKELNISDEKHLKEWQLRVEELSIAVWQVFDNNRSYFSEQDTSVDTRYIQAQNRGRK